MGGGEFLRQCHASCTYHDTGPPSPPQVLMSRVLESYTNYSRAEVTWEPLGNDSRMDFYHYQVAVYLNGTNCTLYDAETTNTTVTVLLSIFPYNVNTTVTFFLSVMDTCGRKSAPTVILFTNYIGQGKV